MLINIKYTNNYISDNKLQFIIKYLKIVNFIYNFKNRIPETIKILKILKQPPGHIKI